MILTDSELLQAGDRAIDRALRWVMGDDTRLDDDRRRARLRDVAFMELDQLEQNLFDNRQGVVRYHIEVCFNGRQLPQLRVRITRQPMQAQAR